jgi:hypothetical protein
VTRFGEASVASLGGGVVTPARNRGADTVRAVIHLVVVRPNASEDDLKRKHALCGSRARKGWVFNPTWPEKDCTICRQREHL